MPYLLIGAHCRLGLAIAKALVDQNQAVRIVSKTGLLPTGLADNALIEVVPFGLEDPASYAYLTFQIKGVIIVQFSLFEPQEIVPLAFVQHLAHQAIPRLVLLTPVSVARFPETNDTRQLIQQLATAELPFQHVLLGFPSEVFIYELGGIIVRNQQLLIPMGTNALSTISSTDAAEAVVLITLDKSKDNRQLLLSGTETYAPEAIAAVLSSVTGQEIAPHYLPMPYFERLLEQSSTPKVQQDRMLHLFICLQRNFFAAASAEAQELLQRPLQPLAAVCADYFGARGFQHFYRQTAPLPQSLFLPVGEG